MTSIICFDYCALIIEVLVFVAMYVRKLWRGQINRWSKALMTMSIVTTIADIVAISIEKCGIVNIPLSFVANTVALWGMVNISISFCGYLFAQVGIWHKIQKIGFSGVVFFGPMVIITVVMAVVNPFVRVIFYLDQNGIYHRCVGIYFLIVICVVYVFTGVGAILRYRRIFPIHRIASIFLVVLMMLVGSIIQVFKPEFVVQNFFTAAAMVVLVFGVQSPEERLHGTTGLFSLQAYVQDINKYTILKNDLGITLAVMSNYETLIEMLGYFKVQKITIDAADRLTKWIKKNKVDGDIYYLGGGRFAVIVDERYKDNRIQISQGINSALGDEFIVDEMQIKVMFTTCFINYPKDIDQPEFLFAFDEKLAHEVYSGELRYAEKLFDKREYEISRDIGKIIDRAFSENLFSVHYQPVYSVEANRYVSAEAFLRLNDSEFGSISPDVLIREAERSSSVHGITTYVIEEVCKFVSMPEFLLLGIDYVEINLSPVQCMWNDLLAVLLSTMKVYNAQAKNICFNITDVENIKTYEKMRDNITALSQIGFKVFMDDFGAGIFEIERIAEMPLAGIKLERDFVKAGLLDENNVVFEGTLRMIKDIGLNAVIVGVENEEMEDKLLKLDCKYLQGYRYCKPIERTELIKFILLD